VTAGRAFPHLQSLKRPTKVGPYLALIKETLKKYPSLRATRLADGARGVALAESDEPGPRVEGAGHGLAAGELALYGFTLARGTARSSAASADIPWRPPRMPWGTTRGRGGPPAEAVDARSRRRYPSQLPGYPVSWAICAEFVICAARYVDDH